jgi:hypothetical protein
MTVDKIENLAELQKERDYLMEQVELANIIDAAVAPWHEVAEEHEIPSCNCFSENFCTKMIEYGGFIGYSTLNDRLNEYHEKARNTPGTDSSFYIHYSH